MKRFCCILALLASAAVCAHGQSHVIVIANSSIGGDAVSRGELRDVYTGNAKNLKDGARVKPAILHDGDTHASFLSTYVGKTPVSFLITWRGLVMSGQATMPKAQDSEAAMVEYVANTPGAIGYISEATPHSNVKVLAVH